METYERIRELRKNYLKMSQTEFGERLGVSRSVINNIELNTLSKPESKAPLLKLICKEFKVSEEWLLNGTGEMFIETDTFSLDEYARERGLSEIDLDILKAYFSIEPEIRAHVLQHIKEYLAENRALLAAKAVPEE